LKERIGYHLFVNLCFIYIRVIKDIIYQIRFIVGETNITTFLNDRILKPVTDLLI